tara:strand:- start:238 stop:1407 length:1170 start_codon:yes stop_codon:yes gene_type:complete
MSEEVKKEGSFKVKKKPGRPRKLVSQDETIKVDLNKKEEDAVEEQKTDEVSVRDGSEVSEEVPQENNEETTEEPSGESKEKEEEVITISEITEEEQQTEEPVVEQTTEPVVEQRQLPENIEKLVQFMEDTGGTVEDYVRINADYSNVDNNTLLQEYYRRTRPHLDYEEISFLMEDNFNYDEEVDDERDIRKKKLAYKEEIAKAKNFLEETKKKYYDEIKLRPGVTQEQQKAMDFFNRYNEEQKMVQEQHGRFKQRTDNFFNKEFKGFNFDVGDKKFRFKVANTTNVAKNQSDLTNLVGKFLDNKGEVKDYAGYHKAIYAAENADTIASHFYEQGKSDAIKDMTAKSKNITEDARQTAANAGDVFINGLRVKAISGANSSKLRIKTKKIT